MIETTVGQRAGLLGDREVKAAVHTTLLSDAAVTRSAPRSVLERRIDELLVSVDPIMGDGRRDRLTAELLDEVDGLGPVQPLLADDSVTEIMLNGGGSAFVERRGVLERVALDVDAAGVQRIAQRVISPLGLRLDRSSPMVDARLADGSRLHAAIPPVAPDGPCLTLRRFRRTEMDLADFGLDPISAALCRDAVRRGWNILVSGATSAGKTTLLGSLASCAHEAERVVTIEETAELSLALPHVVRLEARPDNAEGAGAVTTRDLVRAALRMRPDRIVVGEVRGPEAFDMLQAMNTGHDGALSTIHANSPGDALLRLETLVLLAATGLPHAVVRHQISSVLDAVIHVKRAPDGARRVVEIAELVSSSADELRCRPLVADSGGTLRVRARPTRPARRVAHTPRGEIRCS